MSAPRRAALLLVLAGLAAGAGCGDRRASEPAESAPATSRPAPPLPAGRAVPAGDPETIAALRQFLGPPVSETTCGPYVLLTDLPEPRRGAVRGLCLAVARALDDEIAARFGVAPHHPPDGTIVLFANRRRFRESLAAAGDLPAGYAAWSDARTGIVAMPAGDIESEELARTLAHELAHLAQRRVFGFERPPWLAEGLADAIGDSATPNGFDPLLGFEGVEAQRRRLLAESAPRAARDPGDETTALERLVSLSRDRFDRGAGALDYERSALFVRFLLLDRELAPRFRAWLAAQAWQGAPPEPLPAALRTDWPAIERRFDSWLAAPSTHRAPRRSSTPPVEIGTDPRAE